MPATTRLTLTGYDPAMAAREKRSIRDFRFCKLPRDLARVSEREGREKNEESEKRKLGMTCQCHLAAGRGTARGPVSSLGGVGARLKAPRKAVAPDDPSLPLLGAGRPPNLESASPI